ncbi:hypothetical protein [Ralstonia mannitolilytica]|jgi:hypothetical protein|uniref:Uncharacterized protein n=1 Tax=Ralstonia mannitolilytica TaxID=105219 RepID=A0AAD2AJH3_9RALS|nr:hypothetical protein [Ralstonia mannitolilytica]ATG19114.1 hypothetical protein CO705_04175 [Ralstonia pickettii]MBY4718384.1 hypothetical protein [Ralstonia mannitolilytica]CAJ0681292.1 hypothetical protein R77591_01263 [Ralstonia mannitolilytica]CAJ0693898.1 hypothetical protein LMG18102_01858 [Ralstonia mannitolilytica]CAJ0712331.1 hypothetical protein LMG8323_01886 [Ralstonia mannitolilytica]
MQARKISSLAAAIAVATCAWIGAAPAQAQQKDHSAVTGVDSPMEGPRTQMQRNADAAENPGYHNKAMSGAQPQATPGTLRQKVHRAHVKTDKWVDKHVTHRQGRATAESSSDRAFWSRRANQCDSLVGEAQRICRERQPEAVNGR